MSWKFLLELPCGRECLRDLGMDERMILKCFLRERFVGMWRGKVSMASCYDVENEFWIVTAADTILPKWRNTLNCKVTNFLRVVNNTLGTVCRAYQFRRIRQILQFEICYWPGNSPPSRCPSKSPMSAPMGSSHCCPMLTKTVTFRSFCLIYFFIITSALSLLFHIVTCYLNWYFSGVQFFY